MEISTIVGVLVILFALGYMSWSPFGKKEEDRTPIFPDSIPGDRQQSSTIALPRSYNQAEGLTYSYAGWILVKDFTRGFGTKRRIFSKNDSPGVYLDSTSNAILIAVKTFGTTETILIPNVPAMKWIHLALVVDQHSVDVYINGILRQHHTLGQLPKQDDGAIVAGPGWDGVLAGLYYYNKSLNYREIKALAREPLPNDLELKPSGPQYFDISWYIGRLYSA